MWSTERLPRASDLMTLCPKTPRSQLTDVTGNTAHIATNLTKVRIWFLVWMFCHAPFALPFFCHSFPRLISSTSPDYSSISKSSSGSSEKWLEVRRELLSCTVSSACVAFVSATPLWKFHRFRLCLWFSPMQSLYSGGDREAVPQRFRLAALLYGVFRWRCCRRVFDGKRLGAHEPAVNWAFTVPRFGAFVSTKVSKMFK